MSLNGQLDLVLVHPGTRMQVYQSLGSKLAAIEPPVWASLLATFVRKHGFSVQILDAEADNLTPQETAMRIEEMDPRLAPAVGFHPKYDGLGFDLRGAQRTQWQS